MISQGDPFKTAPRITRGGFVALIVASAATPVVAERDPGEYWDAMAARGVDPLFILAMFNHESNLGRNGTAVQTHSWGNTRTPSFGIDYIPPLVTGRSGQFPVFRTWLDGCVTTVARLIEPTWYYHDRPNIGAIFINSGPVWAPAGDLNDPAGYLRSVLDYMNANADGGASVSAVPTAADLGYPGRVHYATGSGETMNIADVQWFVIHDTEGYFAGDEQTLSGEISAHLLIAKTGEWRFMVPLNTVAYATGNLPVNQQSISVEQSGFADAHDGGYTDAQYRCAAAFYRFCVANGMVNVPAVYVGKQDADGGPEPDAAGILGHQDVPRDDGRPGWGGNYGHTDPGPTYQWDRLIGYIGNAPPPSDGRFFPETGRTISGSFKGFFEQWNDEAKSMQEYGFPVTDVMPETPFRCQYFERACMEDHGGYIQLRRLGAAAAQAAGYAGPGIP